MRAPEYVLMEDYTWNKGPQDTRTLPAGSFVQPVDWYYLPKHIKQEVNIWTLKTNSVCYTHWGFVEIPKRLIRRVV